MKNRLPAIMVVTGLAILAFSLAKILQQATRPLPEISPLPVELSDWRYEMEENWLKRANGRGRVGIPILTRLGQ